MKIFNKLKYKNIVAFILAFSFLFVSFFIFPRNVLAFSQNEYGYILISGFTTGGGANNFKPIEGGLSMDEEPDKMLICLYKGESFTDKNGTYFRYYVLSNMSTFVFNWHVGVNPGRFAVSYIDMYSIESSYIYIFSDKAAAQNFLDTHDPSEAENLDDVRDNESYFDENIPTPSKAYISKQNHDELVYNIEFDSVTYVENGQSYQIYYDVDLYQYYIYDYQFYIKDGNQRHRSVYDDSTDSIFYKTFNLLTVSSMYELSKNSSGTFLNQFGNECYDPDNIPIVRHDLEAQLSSTYVQSVRKFGSYSMDGNLFKGLGWACVYDCAQLRVQPYCVINGVKVYGKARIITKFISDSTQSSVEVRPTDPDRPQDDDEVEDDVIIDDDGDDIINPPSDDDVTLDITDFPKLLKSINQFFVMLRPFLSAVPASIWTLLGLALTVSIALSILNYSH